MTSCSDGVNNNPAGVGNNFFISKHYTEAQKAYELALTKGYRTFDIYSNLGFIYYYEVKDYMKAEKILKEGIKNYPGIDILHSMLSQLYFEIGNFDLAIKEYKKAVELGRDRIITINMEKAKQLLKNEGKSEQDIYNFFVSIINFNPNDYYALYEIALYDKKQNKCEEALQKFKKIMSVSQNMSDALLIERCIC